MTNYVSWKFIDFNLTLTYSLGGHAYDYATWLQSNGGTYHYLGNVPAYYKMEDTWQKQVIMPNCRNLHTVMPIKLLLAG